jgi:hypothetical protein
VRCDPFGRFALKSLDVVTVDGGAIVKGYECGPGRHALAQTMTALA